MTAGTVGITAGTSTPDEIIDRVEERIRQLAAERPRLCGTAGAERTMRFLRRASYTLAARRRVRDRHGLGRSGRRLLPARGGGSCRFPTRRIRCRWHGVLGQVELVREAATLVMLFIIGMLAGRTWSAVRIHGDCVRCLGHFLLCVSQGDLGLAEVLFDWDILFLLPLPWWGPVLAPICIALLMIVWGTLVTGRTWTGHSFRFVGAVAPERPRVLRSRSTFSWPIRCVFCLKGWTRRGRCCRTSSIGRCSRSPWCS